MPFKILIHVKIHYGMVNISEFFLDNLVCWVMGKNINSHISIQETLVDCTKL